jgi:hypothetical protein
MAKQAAERINLTIKLLKPDYFLLRDYCTERGRKLGRRVTHQEAVETATHRLVVGGKRKVAEAPP